MTAEIPSTPACRRTKARECRSANSSALSAARLCRRSDCAAIVLHRSATESTYSSDCPRKSDDSAPAASSRASTSRSRKRSMIASCMSLRSCSVSWNRLTNVAILQ